MDLMAILEGILFVVGDEGITLEQIRDILEVDITQAKELLKKLREEYNNENRGLRVTFLGETFKLTTKKEHKEYYQKLISNPENNLLSTPALEILAIIAYNQPITRVEIDELRGISSYYVIRKLVAKGLIKISGKSDMPGKPNLYSTTSDFLNYFGLATIDDLPTIENYESVKEEKDLFSSMYKEETDE